MTTGPGLWAFFWPSHNVLNRPLVISRLFYITTGPHLHWGHSLSSLSTFNHLHSVALRGNKLRWLWCIVNGSNLPRRFTTWPTNVQLKDSLKTDPFELGFRIKVTKTRSWPCDRTLGWSRRRRRHRCCCRRRRRRCRRRCRRHKGTHFHICLTLSSFSWKLSVADVGEARIAENLIQ